jgi:ABC-type multidrug transport system fused ATPase/permease subunit
MEAGAVMAAGTHEQLLQGNDVYRKLYSMQFDAREGDPAREAGVD